MLTSILQYSVLTVMLIATGVKYILHTIDLRDENPWENKSMYIFHLELVVGSYFGIIYH